MTVCRVSGKCHVDAMATCHARRCTAQIHDNDLTERRRIRQVAATSAGVDLRNDRL